jgi:hypothetical protein
MPLMLRVKTSPMQRLTTSSNRHLQIAIYKFLLQPTARALNAGDFNIRIVKAATPGTRSERIFSRDFEGIAITKPISTPLGLCFKEVSL